MSSFPRSLHENIREKLHILERHLQNILVSFSLPLAAHSIPIGPFFQPQYFFKTPKSYSRAAGKKKKFVCGPRSNMFCLVIEIYWSIVKAVWKYYWSMLNVILKKSAINIISPIFFFHLTVRAKLANTIGHQRPICMKSLKTSWGP